METDLDYAVKQLDEIDLERLALGTGGRQVADRIRRALDALHRMQEARLSATLEMEVQPLEEIEQGK